MPGSAVGRTVTLPPGEPIPALGQGTWRLAEGRDPRAQEIEALRLGVPPPPGPRRLEMIGAHHGAVGARC